jgi:hypothetical protein
MSLKELTPTTTEPSALTPATEIPLSPGAGDGKKMLAAAWARRAVVKIQSAQTTVCMVLCVSLIAASGPTVVVTVLCCTVFVSLVYGFNGSGRGGAKSYAALLILDF